MWITRNETSKPLRIRELQAIAFAAALGLTVDTVLLVSLAERRNHRVRQGWMFALALAAWCWHAGAAVYFLLETIPHSTAHTIRWIAMAFMVAGLLGMPCSLMHAVVRLATTGWFGAPQRRGYEPFLYAPVLLLIPIASSLQQDPAVTFLQQVTPLVLPYLAVTTGISLLASFILWRAAHTSDLPAGSAFLHGLSTILITMAVVLNVVLLWLIPSWPDLYRLSYTILVLLPVPPAVLFAYFVLRYGFLPLVLERTVVYSGILIAIVLTHRSLIAPLEVAWSDHLGIELLWVEIACGVMIIVSYQPLRRRVREGLRYLTSTSVRQFRREVRQLAVDLAATAGHSTKELVSWIVRKLRQLPGVAAVQIMVNDSHDEYGWRTSSEELCPADLLRDICAEWPHGQHFLFADQAPTRALTEQLLRHHVTLLILTEYEDLRSVWALRANPGSEGWDEEELNAVVLLSEQWIAAVRHAAVLRARAAAERRAWQAEKLSALGLLAGSLAHEIKNPLSSIKTLASVAFEESPPGSEQAESLRLVLQELDRLSRTTQQLLGFVRTESEISDAGTDAMEVIYATMQILQHRARQQNVELKITAPPTPLRLCTPREALQSILLNLILNAIEASDAGGVIMVTVSREESAVQLEVRDNGAGISVTMQQQLFQPLVTTKAEGTGLGLYSVAQTLRDLHGDIAVESLPGRGTVFRVTLPVKDPAL